MFNFTTTTVVNKATSINTITDKNGNPAKVQVNRYPILDLDKITKIYVNKTTAAEFAEAEIDLSPANGFTNGQKYRIDIYIRIQGNNESTYANDWVFKGKPLSLGEFIYKTTTPLGGGAATIDANLVDNIVKNIKSKMLTIYGEALVNVTKVSATKLNIKAKTQYQRFIDQDNNAGVKVMHISNIANAFDQKFVGNNINEFGASIVGDYASEEMFADDGNGGNSIVKMIATGKEAFGDFAHIVKDLRLPTGPNTRWYGPAVGDWTMDEANDDRPEPTGHYTQITVEYEADRGVMGAGVVGGLAKSRTVHVFYAKDEVAPVIPGATADDPKTYNTALSQASETDAAYQLVNALTAVNGITPEVVKVPTSVL